MFNSNKPAPNNSPLYAYIKNHIEKKLSYYQKCPESVSIFLKLVMYYSDSKKEGEKEEGRRGEGRERRRREVRRWMFKDQHIATQITLGSVTLIHY